MLTSLTKLTAVVRFLTPPNRTKKLPNYNQQTKDEAIAEAEEALQNESSTLMAIHTELT